MRYSSGVRFSRAKPAGSFRVYDPSSRRVVAHPDTLRESRINAKFWSGVSGGPMEIQERFPSGKWVMIEAVAPKRRKGASGAHATIAGASSGGSKRAPKTEIVHVVQGNYGYGHGWEDVTAEDTRQEALARLREYRENERGVSFRLVRRRERIAGTTGAHATMKAAGGLKVGDAVQFRWDPGTGGVIRRLDADGALVATPRGERKVPIDALRRLRKEHEESVRRAAGAAHARRKKLKPSEAKQLLKSDGIDFRRDFHELGSQEVQRVLEVARLAGYRKRKDAPGSTARMFHQYLSRLP